MTKRIIPLIGILFCLVLTGCSSSKKCSYSVNQTVWTNVSVGEVNGVKGSVFTSLFFIEDGRIMMMCSVKNGNETLVKPFLYARGTYKVEGDSKANANIYIVAETIDGKDLQLSGMYSRRDGILLDYGKNDIRLFSFINQLTTK